jgi:hypothetical protein
MPKKFGKPFDPESKWGTLRNAGDLYEQEGREFTCKELADLARVPERLVSSFLPRWTQVGVLAKRMAPGTPAMWQKVRPWTYAAAKASQRKKPKRSQEVFGKPAIPPSPPPVDPVPGHWSQSEITPLQIGLGVVELINSLRAKNGVSTRDVQFKIRELKGDLIRKNDEICQLKVTIQGMKDNKVLMERQIEHLMSHIRTISGGKGVALSDLLKDPL